MTIRGRIWKKKPSKRELELENSRDEWKLRAVRFENAYWTLYRRLEELGDPCIFRCICNYTIGPPGTDYERIHNSKCPIHGTKR